MRLCITEKPSVARDIASILGATSKREGFYEDGKGEWCVTWTFGHLCSLKEPADYTPMWRQWSIWDLPMVPPRFGIKLIDDEGIKRQFNVIKALAAKADEIVNCGDAGQEGELIQRWVMQLAGVKCPVRRLWISSLTDDSIREGFRDLKPEADYDSLYHAGLSRAIGDWLLGLNATRLYSLKYGRQIPGKESSVLSIGRVQTPTLALIVARQHEIDHFQPTDYWELRTLYRDVTFASTHGRYGSEEEADAVAAKIATLPLTVISVEEKKGREAPEKLFDLTSLQVECNKRWGWSADDTLSLIQSLYEKKLTTYPRVDTTYLTDDIYPKVPGILRRMTPYAPLTAPLLDPAYRIPKSKKVFDNAKVTDHHAIIPTGESPAPAVGRERELYHLIARRFIAAFYPDCLFSTTTVLARADEEEFKATGKVITSDGWRAVYASDRPADETERKSADQDRILPPMAVGESGSHTPSVVKKTTTPPKPYTEGTLLRAMETAGKTVDDEALRAAMKENGIGRPSTRAAIIETLFRRRYIARQGKSIVATPTGIDLIGTIGEELLKSAKLTGLWENKLRRIERGLYSPADFLSELKEMVKRIVTNVRNDTSERSIAYTPEAPDRKGSADTSSSSEKSPAQKKPRKPRITRLEQVSCPLCGRGHILKGNTAYGCSRYALGCPLRLDFSAYAPELTPSALNKLIAKNFKQ